ncbi:hypothetical protein HDU76_001090, partial [Blyttiomyces sp. JEL0837]
MDGGLTVLLVKTFLNGTTITHFTSSSDGSFAFSTSDNQIWYGHVGTTSLVKVRNSRASTAGAATVEYRPTFDTEDESLAELVVQQNSGILSITTKPIALGDILDFSNLITESACPYKQILFQAPFDLQYVRDSSTSDLGAQLPQAIYLDLNKSYNFSITVVANSIYDDLTTLRLAFVMSTSRYASISWQRTTLNGRVLYDVSIRDKGNWYQTRPGEAYGVTKLRLSVVGANFACRDPTVEGWQTRVAHSMMIYSGCAPFRSVAFNWTRDSKTQACPGALHDLPCLFYDDAYQMNFIVRDHLTDIATNWTDSYSLQVIAGGREMKSISVYSAETIAMINQNNFSSVQSLVWTTNRDPAGNVPVLSINESEVSWVCASGSPCYAVQPNSDSPTADYYFVFEMSTETVDLQSYCIFDTQFTVRVYGFPLEFKTSLAITLGSFAGGLVIAGLILWLQWRAESNQGRKVFAMPKPFKGKYKVMPENVGHGASVKDVEDIRNSRGSRGSLKRRLSSKIFPLLEEIVDEKISQRQRAHDEKVHASKESLEREKLIQDYVSGSMELLNALGKGKKKEN